ncbi:MAG: hypothetical protein PSY12_00290 [bacterium]|nr:hypothetical protein [bacterium]
MNLEMDVNYLLHRQQMSLIHAQASHSDQGRAVYEDMARGYTNRIEAYRRENEKRLILSH